MKSRTQGRCGAQSGTTSTNALGFRRCRGRSARPPDETGAASGARPSHPTPAEGPKRTLTVLIIEDGEAVRETMAELLLSEGYAVIQAADGVAGLQCIEQHSVDIVLLDLHLPRLDGIGVLDALDHPPPVVIFSAFEYYNEGDVRARYSSKVLAFLRKPVPPQRLLEVVADAAAAIGGSPQR